MEPSYMMVHSRFMALSVSMVHFVPLELSFVMVHFIALRLLRGLVHSTTDGTLFDNGSIFFLVTVWLDVSLSGACYCLRAWFIVASWNSSVI